MDSGTYTTQAKGKKENRRSEILMREAEYAATMASLVDPSYEYPKKVSRAIEDCRATVDVQRFDAAWEDILLCQFHDVLPGSGIAMVRHSHTDQYRSDYADQDRSTRTLKPSTLRSENLSLL